MEYIYEITSCPERFLEFCIINKSNASIRAKYRKYGFQCVSYYDNFNIRHIYFKIPDVDDFGKIILPAVADLPSSEFQSDEDYEMNLPERNLNDRKEEWKIKGVSLELLRYPRKGLYRGIIFQRDRPYGAIGVFPMINAVSGTKLGEALLMSPTMRRSPGNWYLYCYNLELSLEANCKRLCDRLGLIFTPSLF